MQEEQLNPLANLNSDDEDEDKERMVIAKRRSKFTISLYSFIVVNCLLVAIWYFISGSQSYFWPKWIILGWAIGLVNQAIHAYNNTGMFSSRDEYGNSKNKQ